MATIVSTYRMIIKSKNVTNLDELNDKLDEAGREYQEKLHALDTIVWAKQVNEEHRDD